jgi:hypothetical protein
LGAYKNEKGVNVRTPFLSTLFLGCLLSVVASFLAIPSPARAEGGGDPNGWAMFGGLTSTEFKGDDLSYDRKIGFQFGGAYFMPMASGVIFRTGVGYVQKNSEFELSGNNGDVEFSYLEIPVTFMWGMNSTFSFFGGGNVSLKLDDSCKLDGGSCEVNDPESLVLNLVAGGHWRLTPIQSIEAALEILPLTDSFKDTKLSNSISVRYVHFFQ